MKMLYPEENLLSPSVKLLSEIRQLSSNKRGLNTGQVNFDRIWKVKIRKMGVLCEPRFPKEALGSWEAGCIYELLPTKGEHRGARGKVPVLKVPQIFVLFLLITNLFSLLWASSQQNAKIQATYSWVNAGASGIHGDWALRARKELQISESDLGRAPEPRVGSVPAWTAAFFSQLGILQAMSSKSQHFLDVRGTDTKEMESVCTLAVVAL